MGKGVSSRVYPATDVDDGNGNPGINSADERSTESGTFMKRMGNNNFKSQIQVVNYD
jgi:hypothetical protein